MFNDTDIYSFLFAMLEGKPTVIERSNFRCKCVFALHLPIEMKATEKIVCIDENSAPFK